MIKFVLVSFALVVYVQCRPQNLPLLPNSPFIFNQRPVVPILTNIHDRDPSGQFTVRYVTGDGSSIQEQGFLKPSNDGLDKVLVKNGRYTYITPEGQTVSVSYIADERGYRAFSPNLPVAPTNLPLTL